MEEKPQHYKSFTLQLLLPWQPSTTKHSQFHLFPTGLVVVTRAVYTMSSSYCVLFALATVLVFTLVSNSSARCISTKAKGRMMRSMHRRAQKIRMPRQVYGCILKYFVEVPPVMKKTFNGKRYCYEEAMLHAYLQRAIGTCIYDKPPGPPSSSTSEASVRVALQTLQCPKTDGGSFSCPVSTYYVTSCSCYSGCHFCCIMDGLAGGGWCRQLYCKSGGRCN